MLKTRIISECDVLVAPERSARIATMLRETIDALAAVESLRPGRAVDGLFGCLVGTIVSTPDEVGRRVLADPGIQLRADLCRRLSRLGEQELEHAWAQRVLASAHPQVELAGFPYLDNYRRLVRVESGILSAFLDRSAPSLAFIGAGPLPLSAMLLARDLGVVVDGFDHDRAATDAARHMVSLVGGDVRIHLGGAAEIDLSGYDAVVLAALVGSTPVDKARMLGRFRATMRPGAIVVARSARGLRCLLYPPLDETALVGFDVLTVVHPRNDLVNSVVVARVTEEG